MSKQCCIVAKVYKPSQPGQYLRRRVTRCRHGFGQELAVFLLGELGILVGEHFRDHIQGKLAAVSQRHSEVMSQPVERPKLGRQVGRLADGIYCAAILAQAAVLAWEDIGTI